MAEYRGSVVVAAEPTDVIAYLADLTHLPAWDSSVRTAELEADLGPAVGRRFAVTVGFYGRELDAVYELTEYAAGAAVAWSITGRANGTTRITATPDGDGTRIDYHLEVAMSGLARLLDRGLSAALEGIGENTEAGLRRQFA